MLKSQIVMKSLKLILDNWGVLKKLKKNLIINKLSVFFMFTNAYFLIKNTQLGLVEKVFNPLFFVYGKKKRGMLVLGLRPNVIKLREY
jgi:hypothetical protein